MKYKFSQFISFYHFAADIVRPIDIGIVCNWCPQPINNTFFPLANANDPKNRKKIAFL